MSSRPGASARHRDCRVPRVAAKDLTRPGMDAVMPHRASASEVVRTAAPDGVVASAKALVAVLVGLLSVPMDAIAQEPRTGYVVLNSYSQPPFVQADDAMETGLAPTFVRLLREASRLPVPLTLETVPRKRLEMRLEGPRFEGLALFLAPEFLSKEAKAGRWSVPLLVDENVLVSLRPFRMASPEDLAGMRFGAIAGHIYRVLAPYVEAQKIKREDAPDHISNLKKLCLGRVDFVVMSRSELAGSSELAGCAQPFRWRSFPEPQVIVRRVVVRVSDERVTDHLLAATEAVACSQAWQSALRRYQLSTVGCGTTSGRAGAFADAKRRTGKR